MMQYLFPFVAFYTSLYATCATIIICFLLVTLGI